MNNENEMNEAMPEEITLAEILAVCDHTLLRVDCTSDEMKTLCDQAIKYHCASVCIPPCHVAGAKRYVGDRLKNLVVMPNPLSFPALSKETFLQHDDERKNILVCGSLDRHINKGFDDMIANFHQIAYKYPDCDLDILGGGSEESIEHLKGIIKEHNMEERIHLLGYSKRVDEEMLRHKYFVLCSKTEGLPMALMEAMAMGCACISFNCISGPDEIINDGEDGILVKDQDFNELNKKLGWLIENDDRRNEMARRAIQNIQRFSLQNIGDRWECLIKEV